MTNDNTLPPLLAVMFIGEGIFIFLVGNRINAKGATATAGTTSISLENFTLRLCLHDAGTG